MARRAEIDPQNEPDHDAWSETWGDRALQNLGRWLMLHGLDGEQAALTVEQTWLFYSYVALPTLHERLPMGIAGRRTENLPAVTYYLMFRSYGTNAEDTLGAQEFRSIQAAFAQDFAAPLANHVTLTLEPFEAQLGLVPPDPRKPRSLEGRFRAYVVQQQLSYVGIFVDNLEAELRTVMDPEVVPLWLETPNLMFGGRKPADFLDDPDDRQLRGVITRAKFNLPAT